MNFLEKIYLRLSRARRLLHVNLRERNVLNHYLKLQILKSNEAKNEFEWQDYGLAFLRMVINFTSLDK